MSKPLIRNCIISYTYNGSRKDSVALFHVNEFGGVSCALHRDNSGKLYYPTTKGAAMFNGTGHEHWIPEIRKGLIVDSHCVDPEKLNSGDLRRLARKAGRMAK